jgi:BlaI family penicillinase repressor
MTKGSGKYLSPREQQIMDIVYQRERVNVADVMEALSDPLSNSAVRTHLRILESKGYLRHIEEEGKYIYLPVRPRQKAARSALAQLLTTFFDGSVEKVMATLLSVKETDLSPEELDRLQTMIDQAREKGR